MTAHNAEFANRFGTYDGWDDDTGPSRLEAERDAQYDPPDCVQVCQHPENWPECTGCPSALTEAEDTRQAAIDNADDAAAERYEQP